MMATCPAHPPCKSSERRSQTAAPHFRRACTADFARQFRWAKLSIWKRLHGGSRAMSTCDVILAVWNGQKYLPAMLDSLLSQTTSDFNVVVRDDGSTDGSLEILENYKPKFDGRLSIITGQPTGSATANFAILMRETKADYVLFADQDDVWKPEKVELTLRSLKEGEAKYGKSTPIYFATDIAVVNKDLEVISPS
jgi:glycosyltransferase involved in cell wall biosynthesis